MKATGAFRISRTQRVCRDCGGDIALRDRYRNNRDRMGRYAICVPCAGIRGHEDLEPRDLKQEAIGRIMSQTQAGPGGCLIYVGTRDRAGYGLSSYLGRRWRAPRLAYELMVKPIPDGLYIDHLCRVPSCVNPFHLEPVTPAENIRRAPIKEFARQRSAARTHCKNRHELTEENCRVNAKGHRECRTCRRDIDRRARARRWAAREWDACDRDVGVAAW